MYRQGDVLLVRTDRELPDTARAVPPDAGRVVLARGEATGHAHAIDSPLAQLYEEHDGRRYLRVRAEAGHVRLLHEQHDPIALPPGLYEVRRQREYAPDDIRPVSD
jgi:hypothetical protein